MPPAARARLPFLVCLALSAALAAALGLWRGEAFWSTSDGVYALTARELLHGADLYADVAAAQPPPTFLAGAGLLALSDSLTALRVGLELAVLATALLVYGATARLTGRRWWAAGAGVLAPLTPVMLHENALLTPETLGAPLLLGVALLAARRDRAAAAGALGAVAAATKLSFALPALLVLLVSPARARALAWFAAAGTVLAAAATAVWGAALWEAIVVAQGQSGATAAATLPGLLAQEAWNALPLVLPAALAALSLHVCPRHGGERDASDRALLATLVAAAAGGLLLGLSVVKQGSYVNVVQVAEPPLLVLAAAGAARAVRRRSAAWTATAAAGALLLAAQSGSLLLAPDDPRPYTRPGAQSGPRRLLTGAEVRAFAAAARACPPGAPYPGLPFVAFVAGRPAPGGQPDPFILTAKANAELRRRYVAALPGACPAAAPVVDARGGVAGDLNGRPSPRDRASVPDATPRRGVRDVRAMGS